MTFLPFNLKVRRCAIPFVVSFDSQQGVYSFGTHSLLVNAARLIAIDPDSSSLLISSCPFLKLPLDRLYGCLHMPSPGTRLAAALRAPQHTKATFMSRSPFFPGLSFVLFANLVCAQQASDTERSVTASQAASRATDPNPWHAIGSHGAVAAGGQEAVDAGIRILKGGGNAADGAAATILALSVTDATSFCFGGEVPILAYDAKRGVVEV